MAGSTAKAGEREGDRPIRRGKPSVGGCESTDGTGQRAGRAVLVLAGRCLLAMGRAPRPPPAVCRDLGGLGFLQVLGFGADSCRRQEQGRRVVLP